MRQKIPDFFLIKDMRARKAALQEYKIDHSLSDDELEQMLNDQFQIEGHQAMKCIIARLANTFRDISIDDILSGLHEASNYDLKELRALFSKVKLEKANRRQIIKSRRKLTSSVYRMFKETLCPV